jgi:hypothetical protein
VDQLVTLRRNAAKIRQQTVALNDTLQSSGATVLSKVSQCFLSSEFIETTRDDSQSRQAQQLQEQRRILEQVDNAVRLVQSCQSVLALFERATKQIESKKYYHALKVPLN